MLVDPGNPPPSNLPAPAPTSKPVNAPDLWYPFSPEDKEGRGYVWHCHIIDHEDNEMMRPFIVKAKPGAVRSLVMGRDY